MSSGINSACHTIRSDQITCNVRNCCCIIAHACLRGDSCHYICNASLIINRTFIMIFVLLPAHINYR